MPTYGRQISRHSIWLHVWVLRQSVGLVALELPLALTCGSVSHLMGCAAVVPSWILSHFDLLFSLSHFALPGDFCSQSLVWGRNSFLIVTSVSVDEYNKNKIISSRQHLPDTKLLHTRLFQDISLHAGYIVAVLSVFWVVQEVLALKQFICHLDPNSPNRSLWDLPLFLN